MKAFLAFLLGLLLVGLVVSLVQVQAARMAQPKAVSLANLLPLAQAANLTASDGVGDDNLGYSVAASGGTLVVGAFGDDSSKGSAYVFVKPGGGWVTTDTFAAKLTASDGAANNFFGFSTTTSGETVVIGAQGNDGNRGSAYVFVSHTFLYLPVIWR